MSTFFINHIAISVQDVAVSIAFYQKVFGVTEIENTASVSPTRWLALGDGKQLHLIPRPGETVITNKAVHLALATANLASFITHLKNLNIDYADWRGTTTKDYVRNDGIQQVYFQDPDGYWIEVNDDA